MDDRPVEEWVALARLYSSHQIDTSGGYVPIDSAELRRAWDAVQAGREPHHDAVVPTERPLAWHRQLADRAERWQRAAAAVWHLDRLIDGQAASWEARTWLNKAEQWQQRSNAGFESEAPTPTTRASLLLRIKDARDAEA